MFCNTLLLLLDGHFLLIYFSLTAKEKATIEDQTNSLASFLLSLHYTPSITPHGNILTTTQQTEFVFRFISIRVFLFCFFGILNLQYKRNRITCEGGANGSHNVAIRAYKAKDSTTKKVAVCVHGLSRNSTDFVELGRTLSTKGDYDVFAIDMPGRGLSDWVAATDYSYPRYLLVLDHVLNQILDIEQGGGVDWIGTSMGGLLGMFYASNERFHREGGTRIRKLVMNDIGPLVPKEGLVRLSTYVGELDLGFDTLSDAELYFRKIFKPFGELSDKEWTFMTKHSVYFDQTRLPHQYKLLYDPLIGNVFKDVQKLDDMNMWSVWEKVPSRVQVMVLRGESSDILLEETVKQMRHSGPGISLYVQVSKTGHAPSLFDALNIEHVLSFLSE